MLAVNTIESIRSVTEIFFYGVLALRLSGSLTLWLYCFLVTWLSRHLYGFLTPTLWCPVL